MTSILNIIVKYRLLALRLSLILAIDAAEQLKRLAEIGNKQIQHKNNEKNIFEMMFCIMLIRKYHNLKQ